MHSLMPRKVCYFYDKRGAKQMKCIFNTLIQEFGYVKKYLFFTIYEQQKSRNYEFYIKKTCDSTKFTINVK